MEPYRGTVLVVVLLFLSSCMVVRDQELKSKGYLAHAYEQSGREAAFLVRFGDRETRLFQHAADKNWFAAADLVEEGVNAELPNEHGESIYEYAVKGGMNPLLEILVTQRVPLVSGDAFYNVIRDDHREALELMLDKRLGINKYFRDGSLPLLAAIDFGDPDLVALLLKGGADPALKAKDGRSADDAVDDRKNQSFLPDADFNYEQIRSHLRQVR